MCRIHRLVIKSTRGEKTNCSAEQSDGSHSVINRMYVLTNRINWLKSLWLLYILHPLFLLLCLRYWQYCLFRHFNTLRTGDADLRFYITTVQDGWRKSAFLTRACFSCIIDLIMQYIKPVSEWSCWRMFIETWPHLVPATPYHLSAFGALALRQHNHYHTRIYFILSTPPQQVLTD